MRFPPAHPGILWFSPPGNSQLRPRRLWDHHPLGLCHGSSSALWEHPAGEETAGHPPRGPFVSPCSPGICDNSSLGITAEGWEQHRDTHTGCSTLLQLCLSVSHFQMAPLPSQPAWRKDFSKYGLSGKVHQVLSWDQAAKGRLGSAELWTVLHFICTRGQDLKWSWGHLRSLLAAPPPKCVIRFTGSPPGGKSSLVGRSSEAPGEGAAALGAHAWVTPVFLTLLPGQSSGPQHLLSVAGTRQQHLPKMAFPNDVLATKATCSSPGGLPGSIYSREHKKIALLVPKTPTGPSVSHFSQLWDTAQRKGLAWESLCLSEEEQDFLGYSGMQLGTQHAVLKIQPG